MQSTQCLFCKHYRGSHACDAFPDKIPHEIFTGLHDHLEPFEGDRGIRWEEFVLDEKTEENDK